MEPRIGGDLRNSLLCRLDDKGMGSCIDREEACFERMKNTVICAVIGSMAGSVKFS